MSTPTPPPGPPTWPTPWSPYPGPPPYGAPPTDGRAVTALVLGVLGLVACGPFASVPAIVLGRVATRAIDASQGRLGGRGIATAGFVLGIVATVVWTLAILLVIGLFAFSAAVVGHVGTCTPSPSSPTDCAFG